jgi:methylmalonyl-CoA mutase N-terminal domain/subunit
VVDPLGGAPFVEWMTDEMERQAEAIFSHLLELGDGSILDGAYAGIDNGWFVGEIADASYRFEREVNAGRRIIVGVNDFVEGDSGQRNLLRIGPEVEEYQRKRLADVKQRRDSDAVARVLRRLETEAGDPTINLMPTIIDAVKTLATEGEIVASLESVFGTYVEKAIV